MIRLYIGTQTRGTGAEGIYRCDWDPRAGRFARLELAAAAENPTFAVFQAGTLLAVNEVDDYRGEAQGAVSDYRVEPSGSLALRATLPSHGADPCHLTIGRDEVAVANYTGGTVALYEFGAAGLIRERRVLRFSASGPHRRQGGSHPHGTYYHQDMLLVPDLGGDCVHRIRQASGHSLTPWRTTAGSGPRHLAIAASGRIYVVNELANTVDVFEEGRCVQTVPTLPPETTVTSTTAEIHLSPTGDRLFVSNRGHDSLVSWPVSPNDGRLGAPAFCPSGGGHPRHFIVTADGWLLVANRDGNNLVARRLEPDGGFGAVADTLSVPASMCIVAAS